MPVAESDERRYLSRKWVLSCFIQLSATAALGLGYLEGAVYGEITVAVIVSYSFANAATYFSKGKPDASSRN